MGRRRSSPGHCRQVFGCSYPMTGARAICPDYATCEERHIQSLSVPSTRRRQHRESAEPDSDDIHLGRQNWPSDSAGCRRLMHPRPTETLLLARPAGPRITRTRPQHPVRLQARRSGQRPCRTRTRRLTSSQLSSESGLVRRFFLLRSSSWICQSWRALPPMSKRGRPRGPPRVEVFRKGSVRRLTVRSNP